MDAAESNPVKVSFYAKTIEDTDATAFIKKGAGRWASVAIEFCHAQWSRMFDIYI